MNILSSKVPSVYLAGAIERSSDFGRGWRNRVSPRLRELGWEVINPCNSQLPVASPQEVAAAKATDFNQYKKYMQEIVDLDLELVRSADIVICLLDYPVLKGAGTYGELTMCRERGIPVYAWIELAEGIHEVPGWAVGCITKHTYSENSLLDIIPTPADIVRKGEQHMKEYTDSWEPFLSDR